MSLYFRCMVRLCFVVLSVMIEQCSVKNASDIICHSCSVNLNFLKMYLDEMSQRCELLSSDNLSGHK